MIVDSMRTIHGVAVLIAVIPDTPLSTQWVHVRFDLPGISDAYLLAVIVHSGAVLARRTRGRLMPECQHAAWLRRFVSGKCTLSGTV